MHTYRKTIILKYYGGSMKKNYVSALAISIALLAAAPSFAQIAPAPGFAQDRYKEFKVEKDVVYGTLPNGMRYAIKSWPKPKGEISIRMRIAGGSMHEKDNQEGLMHFLEHMAFNGSANIKEGEMIPLLEREGLAFGADTNAHTSWDETTYQLDMPKSGQLDLGVKIMRETAGRLTLAPKAIDHERGVIKGEERARMSPGFLQWVDYIKTNYDGLLFTDHTPIGDMNVVGTAPQKEFKALYNGLYRPERTFVVIVGDVDAKKAKAVIEKYFNDWKGVGAPLKDPNIGKLAKSNAKFKNYVDAQLPSSINVNVAAPFVKEKDTSEARKNDLLLNIANSIINQRLAKIARKDDAPFVSAFVSAYDYFNQVDTANLDISPKTQDTWQKSLEAADLELRSALQYGFSEDEFKAAILQSTEGYERAANEDKARRSREIAEGIIASFEDDSVYTSSQDDLAWFNKIRPTLSAKDALMQLQEKWKLSPRNVYIVSQKPIEGGEKTIAEKFSQIQNIPAPTPVLEATKNWDYTNFGQIASNSTKVENKDIGATFVTYPNNVRLVVKPTDFEKGRVRVSVRFGDGQFAIPADKIGLNLAASAAFDAGGLGRFTIDDLNKTLAGHSVGTSFGVSSDAFEFSSTTTQKDLLLQMQIFAAYMTDPAWRKDGFNQLIAAKEMIYKEERSTPDNVFWRNYSAIVQSNHPTSIFPSSAQFDALKFDDAKQLVDTARNNSAIEIVIVGDTNVEAASSAVGQTFGALAMRLNAPNALNDAKKISFPMGRKETILTHDGRADQSILSLFYPTSGFGDGSMGRKLNVLRDMLNIKLTDIIREKEGGTYSPVVISNASTYVNNYGNMGIVLNLKPEEIAKYQTITEAIVKDFADGKIDADLLKRAKEPQMASIKTTMANNPWWLNWLRGSSFDANKIPIIKDGQKQYEVITLDDMKTLAKQYLDAQKVQIIKVIPTKK